MPTRTIPLAMPDIREVEVGTRKLVTASLLLRLARATNYLWANLRRVYANNGYEGLGNYLAHSGNGMTYDTVLGPDGVEGLLVSTFLVPPNWSASARLRIRFRVIHNTSAGAVSSVCFGVFRFDDTSTGHWVTSTEYGTSGTYDDEVELPVPQDGYYQVKVVLRFSDLSTSSEHIDYSASESVQITHVSARYAIPTSDELFGDSHRPFTAVGFSSLESQPLSAWDLRTIVRNIKSLWGSRVPEVCQAYLGMPWTDSSSYTEVGRYDVYSPEGLSTIRMRLTTYATHGGAGNEIRVLFNGSVVWTSSSLTVGDQEFDTGNLAVPVTMDVFTITIEARSTAAASNWGTCVWGVYAWETAYSFTTPSSTPAQYEPVDEAAIQGDDIIVALTNAKGERAGVVYQLNRCLQWLAYNRPRGLIGDWRHRTYKRIAYRSPAPNTDVDARSDWTRGIPTYPRSTGRPKNITICADGLTDGSGSTAHNSRDGLAAYPYGLADDQGLYNASNPYQWASYYYMNRHGRRLGRYQITKPTGIRTHVDELYAGYRAMFRARRARPYVMSIDSSGIGPLADEPLYAGKGYLRFDYSGTSPGYTLPGATLAEPGGVKLPIPAPDIHGQWLAPWVDLHLNQESQPTINGCLPSQFNIGGTVESEGQLFEIEMLAAWIADEPLPQNALDLLP